jgi:Flp pilus assembly protein TadG
MNLVKPSDQRKGSRGSVMVETALVFIVFACLLLGAFDFGQFLFVHQALTERARSAARWGAINDPTNTTATVNKVLYDSATQPSGATGYFGLTNCATVTANGTTTQTGGVCANYYDAGTDNARVVVTIVNYQYTILSPYIAGTYSGPNIDVTIPVGRFD